MKICCAAKSIILNDAGEMLLLIRSETDLNRPGGYDLPGGEVESGEYFAAAASREAEEETGLKIPMSDFRLIYAGTSMNKRGDESVNRLLFTAKTSGQSIKLSYEHSEYAWLSIEQVLERFEHHFYNPAIRYVVSNNLL